MQSLSMQRSGHMACISEKELHTVCKVQNVSSRSQKVEADGDQQSGLSFASTSWVLKPALLRACML